LLFTFAVDFAIRRIQVSQDCLKLNGTHQLLVYADKINVLGGSIRTLEENTAASVFANKETDVNKTKYMVMSRGKNAGRNHNVKNDNNSFEKVEEFKYLGITLANQNSNQE